MKSLSIKQILITILISYILMSYINNTFNPFELKTEVRVLQVLVIGFSLYLQAIIKDLDK